MEYKVLDLFCGAGGLSLGFEMAKFETTGFEVARFQIIGGIEFNKDAMDTHESNFPNGYNICRDISSISDEEIIEKFEKVDVIIGGPPCQGFSAGNMHQTQEEREEKNKLFYQFIRFIKLLKPQCFVMENVPQILTRNNGYAKEEILKIMKEELGYTVNIKVLDASNFGVPQRRRRAFFVGFKDGTDFDFKSLETSSLVTVKEAIGDLEEFDKEFHKNTLENLEKKDFPLDDSYKKAFKENIKKSEEFTISKTLTLKKSEKEITSHNIRYPKIEVQERMIGVPEGGNWRDVKDEKWVNHRLNRHSSAYRRLESDKPSVTIDTGHMNYFHYKFNRVPTVRESARLQSFPDSFKFTGTATSQFRQVGNAVPPLLAKAIANKIIKILEEKRIKDEK